METEEKNILDAQWKSEGRCSRCRRKDYCKTQCRANREAIRKKAQEIIRQKLGLDQAKEAIEVLGGKVESI